MILSETLFPHLWEVQQTCEETNGVTDEGIVGEKSSSRQGNTAAMHG